MKPIIGIACISNNKAIGSSNGKLIYEMYYDMKHFQNTTCTTKDKNKINAVIMGNKTYQSIRKPLANRINYVITHSSIQNNCNNNDNSNNNIDNNIDNNDNNLYFCNNILTCLMEAQSNDNIESIYIIGGASIYQFCFDLHLYDELILSYVHSPKNTSGNVYFPYIDFNKYYIYDKKNSVKVFDKKTQTNQNYIIYYLKKYDNLCDEFIKIMSF